jgi:ketosteroid isomerase-like protein
MAEESTTPDLVERTHALLEASKRHDLDAYMGFFAPHAVFDLSDLGIGTFAGAAAIRGFIVDWWGSWANHRSEVEEIADLGHGVVFARAWEDGRLLGSDGHVEQRVGRVLLWVQGMIERFAAYLDIDHARTAAERLAEERADA